MTSHTPSRPEPVITVRRDNFDRRKRLAFGDLPEYEIAEKFGLHKSTFSLLMCGRATPSPKFIRDALRLLEIPGEPAPTFEELFEPVEGVAA